MSMITSVHAMIYSTRPEVDRAFLRDVLGLSHVDAGGGFTIFGVPTGELAVHEGGANDVHELWMMCNDVEAFVETMKVRGIACPDVEDRGWGLATQVALPGGGKLGVYEPRHPQPQHAARAASAKPAPKAKAKRASAKTKPKPRPAAKAKPKAKSKPAKTSSKRNAGARTKGTRK
jgi:hypothetical protein